MVCGTSRCVVSRTNDVKSRRVVIFALPGAFSLDVLGALEIFHGAAQLLTVRTQQSGVLDLSLLGKAPPAYEVELVAARAGQFETLSGVGLFATRALTDVRGPVDTLVVAGGDIARMLRVLAEQPELKTVLRRVARRARRVTSVCTGAFVLAHAGLLDGKRATTHWAACELLQQRYPAVRVEREPIYTQDGNVYTSAGASTGMDLSLALVREDHGHELAHELARWLVLYVARPATQAQWSTSLRAQASDHKPLRELQPWIEEQLCADLSVGVLAERVGMSPRNFARAFKRELGVTPAGYVERVRVEAARRKLQLGAASIAQIADEVGFGCVDTLRRAFMRQTGGPPSASRALRLVERSLP
jgi:transcriptional regulator GlxA family with amidase domain